MMKFLQNSFLIIMMLSLVSCAAKRELSKEKVSPAPISVKEEPTVSEKIALHKKQKNYKNIIELYEGSMEEVTDVKSLSYVMEAYYINKRFKDVIAVGDKFYNLHPNYEDGRLNLLLGVSYYHLELYEAARRNFIKAKESGLKNKLISFYLVDIYLKKGQSSLALIETSDLEGEMKEFLQGIIYFNENNYEKAYDRFNKLSSIRKSIYFKAYCLYKLNRHDELLKLWEEGMLKDYVEFYSIVANIYLKMGEILKSKEVLKDAAIKQDDYAMKNLRFIEDYYLFEKSKLE